MMIFRRSRRVSSTGTAVLAEMDKLVTSLDLLSSFSGPDSRGGVQGWCRRIRVRHIRNNNNEVKYLTNVIKTADPLTNGKELSIFEKDLKKYLKVKNALGFYQEFLNLMPENSG